VRSGAANPLSHDHHWTKTAFSGSHSNLQALRELDSHGEPFLRARSAGASLVLGSPEALATLSELAAVDWSADVAPALGGGRPCAPPPAEPAPAGRAPRGAGAAPGLPVASAAAHVSVSRASSCLESFSCRTQYFPIA
jgi:hypothetical protein